VPTPSPEVRRAVAPLLEQPATTAIVTDFDGTLAPIRPRPDDVHVSATIAMRLFIARCSRE